MLSIINRRLFSSVSASSSLRPLLFLRSYTVIPSTPQQQNVSSVITDATTSSPSGEVFNSVHALYNNENQSLHESQYLHTTTGSATYRSLSEDDHSIFSPTFNSVFDE